MPVSTHCRSPPTMIDCPLVAAVPVARVNSVRLRKPSSFWSSCSNERKFACHSRCSIRLLLLVSRNSKSSARSKSSYSAFRPWRKRPVSTSLPDNTPSLFQSCVLNDWLLPFHSARETTPSLLESIVWKRRLLSGLADETLPCCAFAQNCTPPEPGTLIAPNLLLYSAES